MNQTLLQRQDIDARRSQTSECSIPGFLINVKRKWIPYGRECDHFCFVDHDARPDDFPAGMHILVEDHWFPPFGSCYSTAPLIVGDAKTFVRLPQSVL